MGRPPPPTALDHVDGSDTGRRSRPSVPGGGSYLLLVVLLGALSGIGPLAIDMYLPSFPSIAAEFGTSVSAVERTLATYFIGLSLGQLVYGPLADRFGRKRPLYVGLLIFLLTSVGCAFATSVEALAALRFFQALGGCAQMVVARAVVRDLFEERQAARVFSALILVMGVAPIVAPVLGGWLVVTLGWRSIFFALAAFAGACLVATIFLPESLPVARRRRRSLRETLIVYLGLLRHRAFMVHTLAGSLASAALFAYIGGSPFVFMELYQVPEDQFGFYFGANAFGLIVASQFNGALTHRLSPQRIVRGALVVATIAGLALLTTAVTGLGGFVGVLAPLFVLVSSLGFILPSSIALAMAPHGEHAGSASAVYGFLQFLLSGAGGLIVGAFHDDSAVPMAVVIAASIITAMAINLLFARSLGGSRGAKR